VEMRTYRVRVIKRVTETFEIEAFDEELAREKVLSGGHKVKHREDVVERDTVAVMEVLK